MSNLTRLSDAQLLSEIAKLAATHRRCTSQIVEHLAELDARGSHLDLGYSSLFSYCVEALGFSEDEACRRIDAARIGRCFPAVFERIASGDVSLTVLVALKPHLAKDNVEELLNLVARATVRTARERLSARFPQPDSPELIRKLPAKATVSHAGSEFVTVAAQDNAPDAAGKFALSTASTAASPESRPRRQAAPIGSAPRHTDNDRWQLDPLAQDRFVLRVTVHRKVRDDLEQARDLLRHKYPSGALESVLGEALELLVQRLRAKKFGETRGRMTPRVRAKGEGPDAPRAPEPGEKTSTEEQADPGRAADRSRHVTASTRREVVARDRASCDFVGPDGRRCGSTAFLEFDHVEPVALGGGRGTDNVRCLCRAHNQREAERVFGTEYVRAARNRRVLRVKQSDGRLPQSKPS